jgi:3-methyladenine DNA glycosylase AlkD
MTRTLRAWSRSGDLWKRRSAILAQLHFKQDTDLALLYDCIEPAIAEQEFFLRKAIGWALREYSKTDAAEVRRYVRANAARLSGLSRREALKVVGA